MKLALRARDTYKKVTLFTAAFVLAVSSLTASVPFILSQEANAVPGYNYTNVGLDQSGWIVDRQAPSGGWFTDTANQRVVVTVNQNNAHSDNFRKTEGVSTAVASGSTSVSGSFYIAPDWQTKTNLRVGLWGVTDAPTSWPIIEYAANVGGYTGWRIWDTVDGGWTNVNAPANPGRSTVEILVNPTTNKFTFVINNVSVATLGAGGTQSFVRVILNHYNAGTNNNADNYVVDWRNLRAGKAPVTTTCVTPTTQWATTLADWTPSDTRPKGHNVITGEGINVYTDDNSTDAKATGYKAVNYPLAQNGTKTIAESMEWTQNYGTLRPGLQLVVDFDNNGSPDGILVGEVAPGYGNAWWLTNSAQQFAKDGAPRTGGGHGSNYFGTINEWLSVFPDAQVKAVGYSLGSGVYAGGVIKSMTFGCVTYKFDSVAPTVSWQKQPEAVYTKDQGFHVRPITNEVGTLKKIYVDSVTPANLVRELDSDHKNFDTTDANNPALWTSLADGTHKFIAVFSDHAGNTTTKDSNSFLIDRTGPTITVKPESLGTNGVYRSVSFKLFDANKVDKVYINNVLKDLSDSTWSDVNGVKPGTFGGQEGPNTIVAYDIYGNTSSLSFTIDTTAPSYSSITSPSGWTLSANTITWSASTDANGPITYTLLRSTTPNVALDGVELVSGTTATSFNYPLPVGPQWLQVIAKDAAGNTAVGPVQGVQVIGVPVITAPTQGKILNATDGSSYTATWTGVYGIGGVQSYEIEYGVDRDNSGVIDADEYVTRTVAGNVLERTQQFSTNFQGLLSIKVRAIYNIPFSPSDPTSNRGPWSEEVFYSRDTILNVDITPSTSQGGSPVVAGTADADASLVAKIDGTEYPVVKDGTNWSVTVPADAPLTAGTHTFVITATDPAGNTQERTADIVVAVVPEEPVDNGGENGNGGNTGGGTTDGTTDEDEDEGEPATTPTVATVVPLPIGPGAIQQVLGESTDNTQNNENGTPEVEGVSTQNNVAQAVNSDANQGRFLGLAWYWWILILAAIALLGWWIAAAIRRRRAEEN